MLNHEGVAKSHTGCMLAICATEQHMTNIHLAHYVVNNVYINE
jgi:hypothetical protein